MTKQEFADFARDLSAYYGRQAMTSDRLVMIFPKIEHIPSEAIRWMLGNITDVAENMPSNIGKSMMASYQAWMDVTPGAKVKIEFKPCQDCNYGIIFAQRVMYDRFGNPLTYRGKQESTTAAFGCTSCEQAPCGIPRASKKQLLASGWRLQSSESATGNIIYERKNEARKNGAKNLPPVGFDTDTERARRLSHIPDAEKSAYSDLPF